MSIYSVREHGRPETNTVLKIIKNIDPVLSSTAPKAGDLVKVKVTQEYASSDEVLVIRADKENSSNAGGWYIQKWALPTPFELIGKPLDADVQQALTDAALASAKKRGYCDETKKILGDLGLPTEASIPKKKITIEIEYTAKDNYEFHPDNLLYNDHHTEVGNPVIRITSAKEVKDV